MYEKCKNEDEGVYTPKGFLPDIRQNKRLSETKASDKCKPKSKISITKDIYSKDSINSAPIKAINNYAKIEAGRNNDPTILAMKPR